MIVVTIEDVEIQNRQLFQFTAKKTREIEARVR